jgi:DNA-binding transcriptional LysR family regulator
MTILQPVVTQLVSRYPDIEVEPFVDYGLTNIVAEGYDAGVRLGEQVAKDMVAVRIERDVRMAVVGSPVYFSHRSRPKSPRDLIKHDCITLRLPTYGSIFPWEFEKKGEEIKVRVEGRLIYNTVAMRIDAALKGLGLVYMPEDLVLQYISSGELTRVLSDWCPAFSGYHLYYPSRRQSSQAFSLLRDALRYEP